MLKPSRIAPDALQGPRAPGMGETREQKLQQRGAKRGGLTDHLSGVHLIPNVGREAMVPGEVVCRRRPAPKPKPKPQPKPQPEPKRWEKHRKHDRHFKERQ